MSDDAEQYWNAWCGVFGKNSTKKRLCVRHVDRAWRKDNVSSKQDRIKLCIIGSHKMKATATSACYVDPHFLLNIHIPPDMTLNRLKQLTV